MGYSKNLADQKSYLDTLKNIRRAPNIWKQRRLTLAWKIVIVKTFMLYKIHAERYWGSLFLNLSLLSKSKSKVDMLPVLCEDLKTLWSNILNMEIITQEDVPSRSIWDNKFITIQGKPIFEPILANKGIHLILQLYNNGRVKTWKKVSAEFSIQKYKASF